MARFIAQESKASVYMTGKPGTQKFKNMAGGTSVNILFCFSLLPMSLGTTRDRPKGKRALNDSGRKKNMFSFAKSWPEEDI